MNNQDIKCVIEDFTRLIEEGQGSEDDNMIELLRLLDTLAYSMHHARYAINDEEDKEWPERKQYEDDRKLVEQRFGNLGYYNAAAEVVDKIAESEIIVGEAIVDIADIYGELKETLWRWERNGVDDALWYFKDFYIFHWENHLRHLQLYLMARAHAD